MKKMVAKACRTLVQSRHPSSPPSWPEGTIPPADAAGAWIQEDEGGARREPPAVRRETSSTPKTEEEGPPRGPEPQPWCSRRSQSPVDSVDSVTVRIPWPLAKLEGTTPEWCRWSAQALAFLLGCPEGVRYCDWDAELEERPEFLLDPPDTSMRRGRWTARMHNNTVGQALNGLWSARAATLLPVTTNQVLRGIPRRQDIIAVEEAGRGDPVDDATRADA